MWAAFFGSVVYTLVKVCAERISTRSMFYTCKSKHVVMRVTCNHDLTTPQTRRSLAKKQEIRKTDGRAKAVFKASVRLWLRASRTRAIPWIAKFHVGVNSRLPRATLPHRRWKSKCLLFNTQTRHWGNAGVKRWASSVMRKQYYCARFCLRATPAFSCWRLLNASNLRSFWKQLTAKQAQGKQYADKRLKKRIGSIGEGGDCRDTGVLCP